MVSEIHQEAVEQLTNEEVFAYTLYGECRGEPFFGQVAVACVIRNRVMDKRWPGTYRGVCLQDKQFSCWNEPLPLSHIQAAIYLEAFKRLWYIVEGVRTFKIPDITQGANHYINAFARPSEPKWAQNTNRIVLWPSELVGAHAFYRL